MPVVYLTPLLLLALLSTIEATTKNGQNYLPEDVTHISFYGNGAVYNPKKCPKEIMFMGRASALPGLQPGRLGFLPSDMLANGAVCTADVPMLDMFPIGDTSEHTSLPPQWIFEDSSLRDVAVNFSCGDTSFSIMYGYFNDVKTNNGFLDHRIVYFDFAVYPYTQPFSFCSYANRMKEDGWRPLDRAPFPIEADWNMTKKINEKKAVKMPEPMSSSPDGTGDENEERDEGEEGPKISMQVSERWGKTSVPSWFSFSSSK